MPRVPTKTGLRVAGLVPNVVYYDAQNKPYYRKINAAAESPTVAQPETTQSTVLASHPEKSKTDTTVNLAVKMRAQEENDYRQGVSDYNTLNKLIDQANQSGNETAFSKAAEYVELNKSSLSNVLEAQDISSLTRDLKDTSKTIRDTKIATKAINDQIEVGNLTQARVYAEKYQTTLEKGVGKAETTRYINELREVETNTKTAETAINRINKAIDANNYSDARKIAETNRNVLEKTVGIRETNEYLNQIRDAEQQSVASQEEKDDLTISKHVRDITEPTAKFLHKIVPTREQFDINVEKSIKPEGQAYAKAVGRFGEEAYRTLVPGTVEFVGQAATAVEFAAKHPEKVPGAAVTLGTAIGKGIKEKAETDPFGLAGSFAGMVIGGKILAKVPGVAKTAVKTPGKIVSKTGAVIDDTALSLRASREADAALAVSKGKPIPSLIEDIESFGMKGMSERATVAKRAIQKTTKTITEVPKSVSQKAIDISKKASKIPKTIKSEFGMKGLTQKVEKIKTGVSVKSEGVSAGIKKVPGVAKTVSRVSGIPKTVTAEFGNKGVFKKIKKVESTINAKTAGFTEKGIKRKITQTKQSAISAVKAPGESVKKSYARTKKIAEDVKHAFEPINVRRYPKPVQKGGTAQKPSVNGVQYIATALEEGRVTRESRLADKLLDQEVKVGATTIEDIPKRRAELINKLLKESDMRLSQIEDQLFIQDFAPTPSRTVMWVQPTKVEKALGKKAKVVRAEKPEPDLFHKGKSAIVSGKKKQMTGKDYTGTPLEAGRVAREKNIAGQIIDSEIKNGELSANKAAISARESELSSELFKKTDRQLSIIEESLKSEEFASPGSRGVMWVQPTKVEKALGKKAKVVRAEKPEPDLFHKGKSAVSEFELREMPGQTVESKLYQEKLLQKGIDDVLDLMKKVAEKSNIKFNRAEAYSEISGKSIRQLSHIESSLKSSLGLLPKRKLKQVGESVGRKGKSGSATFKFVKEEEPVTQLPEPKPAKEVKTIESEKKKTAKPTTSPSPKKGNGEGGTETQSSGLNLIMKEKKPAKPYTGITPKKSKGGGGTETQSSTGLKLVMREKEPAQTPAVPVYDVRDYDGFGLEDKVRQRPAEPKSAYALISPTSTKQKQQVRSEFEPIRAVRPKTIITPKSSQRERVSEFGVSGVSVAQRQISKQIQRTEIKPVVTTVSKPGTKQVIAQVIKPAQKVQPKQTVKPKQIAIQKPKPKVRLRQKAGVKTKPAQAVKTKPPVVWGKQETVKKFKKRKGSKKTEEFAPVEMPFENGAGTKYKKQKKQKNQKKVDEYGI
ncbi:MAG: hypothetical protein PHN44_02325 [Candidatus Marinimicrobia bacterium]|nr:hypothetical protein [Candidatus Neomarinimicrobiota bacterium]